MRLTESSAARIGLVALAMVHWRYASLLIWTGLGPLHPISTVLATVLYASSFALLFGATAAGELRRRSLAVFASLALVVIAYGYRDAMLKLRSDTMPTTDGHVFMDVAARLLIHGENPYKHSLLDAFRIYRMPLSYSTPLLDGDISDRAAYPALSFVVLVPFVLLHIPTYLVYAACFVAALALVVWKAPWWLRGIVLSLFTFDDTLLSFSFGGVTDTVWVLCLVGVVFTWKKPARAAFLLGLACAYKQHAWFALPFLLARLCIEQKAPPWRGVPRTFLLIVAGVFAIINVPFVLWGAGSFMLGITEPLAAPMVQLSDGLTALSMTGAVPMPRAGSAIFFWLAYAIAIFVYVRHAQKLRELCWIAPGIVLWLGYRALMSYWFFYALTLVAALVVSRMDDGEGNDEASAPASVGRVHSPKLALGLGVAYAISLAAFLLWCGTRPPPFEVRAMAPLETWDAHVFRENVHVTNRTDHVVHPHFWMQASALQPLPWKADFGPPTLAPGESGDYLVRSLRPYSDFDISTGARLSVVNDFNKTERAFVDVLPDFAALHVDGVPNGRFAFVETRSGEPLFWSFDKSDPDVSLHVAPDIDGDERVAITFAPSAPSGHVIASEAPQLAVCVVAQHIEKLGALDEPARFGRLITTLALPASEVIFHVRVPEEANRAPFDRLYGVRLAVPGFRGYLLFGDDVQSGELPGGEKFISLPAPRGAWSEARVSLRTLLEALHAPLTPRRFTYARVPQVDIPSVPLEIGLFATAPKDATARVEFGAIEQVDLRPIDALATQRDDRATSAWHGAFDVEQGSYGNGAALLERAANAEPTAERWILLGDAQLLNGHPDSAEKSYEQSLALGSSAMAEKGLGWALLGLKNYDAALPHFQRARDLYAESERVRPRAGYLDALRGFITATAKTGDCEKARALADEMKSEAPSFPAPAMDGCK